MTSATWKKYLLWFANEHVEFRLPEIQSIASLFNINIKWLEKPSQQPYWVVELPSEKAVRQIASRSIGLRCCLELWAQAKTEEELHMNVKAYPLELMKPYFKPELSFKINVETFCNRQTQAEKVAKIESFSYLPLEGPVRLKDPDICLQLIEYYGLDSNNIPEKPYELFFGRWIADGQRDVITKLSLKTRKFIGNTSMDPQLSLYMANQALVQNGDLVLDPFVGTGSLLVAASHFGGYVLGSDIDFLMLHGKTRPTRIQQKKERDKDESVHSNMQQYGRGSHYLDVIVADAALPLWRSTFKLDSIITDPPYGIREATERIGTTKNYQISDHHLLGHIPSKVEYGLQHIYHDLFRFAAQHLKMGGRLVCWVPVVRDDYSEDKLPTHPCFQLLANSEQVLTTYTSRRLLTLEKIQEPHEEYSRTEANTLMGDFRAKFFRYGEEHRKQRKLRKALAREAYLQSAAQREEPTDGESQDRDSSSSER
ncbi:tRNA (guanine(10)-N2)-methyltransferase homolog [Periplaneta americana]|uniref:tRNA (guanine(10)-N2)-methyltransferase homolog n=1 Tax=Periplaneta americana TaxID=6978 RepID=UPI0037E96304